MSILNGEPLESSGTFLSRFCIQLILILVLPRILHFCVLQRLLQPRVVSEIISGIILGPSCLGQLNGFTDNVFPARSLPYLQALGQMGAFVYLFMTGCLLDLKKVWEVKFFAVAAAFVGSGLSFALAPGLNKAIYSAKYTVLSETEFMILIVILLSISAASVLARILSERGMLTSSIGSVCMATATTQVFMCFILLAAVISMYGAEHPWVPPTNTCNGTVVISPNDAEGTLDPLYILLIFGGYIVLLLTVGRMLFRPLVQRVHQKGYMEGVVFVAAMVLCLASVWFCQTLTVSSILGGLCLGIFAVPRFGPFCQLLESALGPIVVGIFLPVFFALVGLKADWTLLNSHDVGIAFLLFGSLWVTTFLGAMGTAYFFRGGFSFESLYFSILVTCKGLTVLTILTICLNVGVITKLFYSVCVLYAIISCISVSPIVALFQQVEAKYRQYYPEEKREEESEEMEFSRIIVIPQTSYLAPIAATVAAWLSNSLYPDVKVHFVRFIDDLENIESYVGLLQQPVSQSILSSDLILGPSQVRWNGMRASCEVSYQGVLLFPSGEKAYHKLAKESNHLITHQIIGYDRTQDSKMIVTTALTYKPVPTVIVTGHPGIVLAGAKAILVINSSVNSKSLCMPFLNEFSRATLTYWSHDSDSDALPPSLQHFSSFKEIITAFSSDNPPHFDAICFGVDSNEEEFFVYLDAAAHCHVPVIVEITNTLEGESEMKDVNDL